MTDLPLHYRLFADALPSEEKRIRTSYLHPSPGRGGLDRLVCRPGT